MLKASGVLVLGATTTQGVIHLLSDAVKVDTGAAKRSVVTITRTGRFNDPRYGEFELTQSMFDSMIKNFNDGVYGQEIFIDIAHKPEDGAGAVVNRLVTDRGRLRAEVEWYELGINKVDPNNDMWTAGDATLVNDASSCFNQALSPYQKCTLVIESQGAEGVVWLSANEAIYINKPIKQPEGGSSSGASFGFWSLLLMAGLAWGRRRQWK
ncbi:hypothetical protein NA76_21935 [Vibrio vulnificus]|nr:hypothetical protein NA76_21935 [Vibrio vulnificus]